MYLLPFTMRPTVHVDGIGQHITRLINWLHFSSGFKRYHTDEVVELRDILNEAEQLRDELVKATSRKVFR